MFVIPVEYNSFDNLAGDRLGNGDVIVLCVQVMVKIIFFGRVMDNHLKF